MSDDMDMKGESTWRKPMRILGPLFLSFLIFAVIYYADRLGFSTTQASFIEALIAASIAFVAFQIKFSELLVKVAAERVDAAVRLIASHANDLARTNNTLNEISGDFSQMDRHLNSTSTAMHQLLSQVGAIVNTIPNISALGDGLAETDATEVTVAIVKSLNKYSDAWIKSAIRHKYSSDSAPLIAYSTLIQEILARHSSALDTDVIDVSSALYASLVIRCANVLHQNDPAFRSILFLITAMLPSEFFNWPQAELVRRDTLYKHIPHTWEGAQDYFCQMKDLTSKMVVRRCILVRGDKANTPAPLLRTVERLTASKDVYLYEHPLLYSTFIKMASREVFTETTGEISAAGEAEEFIDINKFLFYPTARAQTFSDTMIRPHGRLLDMFIEQLHSDRMQANYHIVDEAFANQFQEYINPNGLMPEIAAFGMLNGDGTVSWRFAILGTLRPFTESMKMQFFSTRRDNQTFVRFVDRLYHSGIPLDSIRK